MTTLSENDLLTAVLDLCALYGVRVAHFRPARTAYGWRTPVSGDGKGFPDLVLAGAGGVAFRELKGPRGRMRPDQTEWQHTLLRAEADVDVWTPKQLHDGTITRELQAISGRGRAAS